MKRYLIAPNEYYHVMNRGNRKQNIFKDEKDRMRFLFLILYLQSPLNFPQLGRTISTSVKSRTFDRMEEEVIARIAKNRYVELTAFALMPNHFHVLVYEKKKGGTSKYMQRVLTAYTKYFNTKYGQSGHLFQGSYKAVHQKDDKQLAHTSAYIHRNPYELKEWKRKVHKYPWSSYQDYVGLNRWGELLQRDIILGEQGKGKDYKEYVDKSRIKEPYNE